MAQIIQRGKEWIRINTLKTPLKVQKMVDAVDISDLQVVLLAALSIYSIMDQKS